MEVHYVQAARRVVTELVYLLLPRADIVAGIPTIVDTVEEHQVLMILAARVIMVELVIINVNPMAIQIVQICTLVVEPLAVPRSSRVATSSAPTSSTSAPAPSSVASSRSRLLLAIYQFNNLKVVYK